MEAYSFGGFSDAQREAILAQGRQLMARESLIDFGHRVVPWFQSPRHIRYLAELLEKVERGEITRLGISIGPGHGKSTLLQLFVDWFLGRKPERRILTLSANEDLANRNSRSMRAIVRDSEHWPWPDVKLVGESLGEWYTSEGGGVRAIGQTGTVTGFRAEMILCLDRDQLVYAQRGAVKVSSLSLNDRVLTRGGTYERVLNIGVRTADRYRVTLCGFPGFPVVCSPEHPFLLGDGLWVRAEDLRVGNKVVRPRVVAEGRVPDGFPETEDFWAFVGWVMAEGSIKTYTLALTIHEKERDLIVDLCARLGFSTKTCKTGGRGMRVTVTGIPGPLKAWLHNLHLGPCNKAIPSEIHHLPDFLKVAFVRGWFEGDGTFRQNKRGQWEANVTTKSPGMASSLRLLLTELGVNASLIRYEQEFHGQNRPCHRVYFKQGGLNRLYPGKYPPKPRAARLKGRFDPLLSTVTRVEQIESGEVVSVKVENDPTICVPGAVTHNCDDVQPDAGTDTTRATVEAWFRDVLSTRLEPNGVMVIIQTRWHDDDLLGRLANGPDASDWTFVNIPALAIEGREDPFYRAPGEALWPERWPIEKLERIRLRSASAFEAQYQGDPVPAGGRTFLDAWMQKTYPHDSPPDCPIKALVIDSAWKTGPANDYSVLATWGFDFQNFYLLDVLRGKWEFPDLQRWVLDRYGLLRPQAVVVEEQQSGLAILQQLHANTAIPLVPVRPKGDKLSRAQAVTPLFEGGRVVLPDSAPWLDAWKHEHLRFPAGKDDQVDTTSMALSYLSTFIMVDRPDYTDYEGFLGR